MNENDVTVEQGFYQAVAEVLGCPEHSYRKFPYGKRTRWNNRESGNGRYPGFGIVRRFSADCIHVALDVPGCNGRFKSEETALAAIKLAMNAKIC